MICLSVCVYGQRITGHTPTHTPHLKNHVFGRFLKLKILSVPAQCCRVCVCLVSRTVCCLRVYVRACVCLRACRALSLYRALLLLTLTLLLLRLFSLLLSRACACALSETDSAVTLATLVSSLLLGRALEKLKNR